MRALVVFSVLFIAGLSTPLQAAEPIPPCRYDNSLIPVVKQAVEWAIADFKASLAPLGAPTASLPHRP